MMDYEKILSQLRSLKVETHSMACLGCGKERNCSTRGCAVIRSGIDAIEELLIERENYRLQLGDCRKMLQDSEVARSDLGKRLALAQQERDAVTRRMVQMEQERAV